MVGLVPGDVREDISRGKMARLLLEEGITWEKGNDGLEAELFECWEGEEASRLIIQLLICEVRGKSLPLGESWQRR